MAEESESPGYMRRFEKLVGDVFSELGITLHDVVTRESLKEGGHNLDLAAPEFANTRLGGIVNLLIASDETSTGKPDQNVATTFGHAPGLQYIVSGKFFGNYDGQDVVFEIKISGGDDYVDLLIEPNASWVGSDTDNLGCLNLGVSSEGQFLLGGLFYLKDVEPDETYSEPSSDEYEQPDTGTIAGSAGFDGDVSEPPALGYKRSGSSKTTQMKKVGADPVAGFRRLKADQPLVTEMTAGLLRAYLIGYLEKHKELIGWDKPKPANNNPTTNPGLQRT